MYFAKDEIIELNDNKKYLVLNAALRDDNVYYKVVEVNEEETERIGKPIYITTSNRQGRIYINNRLTAEETEEIKQYFED